MDNFQTLLKKSGEIGYVSRINHYIAFVSGLPSVKLSELVVTETGDTGQVVSLSRDTAEVLLFTKKPLKVGTRVAATGDKLSIGAGMGFLGSAVDALGRPLDGKKRQPKKDEERMVDIYPTGIATRVRIHRPLETGVRIVDMLVPLGHGQRELVIGDRKTGKTQFVLQTMLTQAKLGTIVIYAAVGKKKLDIRRVEEFLVENKIDDKAVIIAASSEDPAGVIFITPYSAMTMAEYFRDAGHDVLLVLDDLTTHAKFYREIALLGGRFPGRNSYPSDIFHTHARLLERGGNFKSNGTEHAITCLVVAESTQGDLSGYVQTNLMSMTDGHLFFDNDLLTRGKRPSVNTMLSVTRVGKQTQSNLARDVTRELSSFLTYYAKMQNFTHFGAELSDNVRRILAMGEKIDFFFQQPSRNITPIILQLYLFSILWKGAWQDKTQAEIKQEMETISKRFAQEKSLQKALTDTVTEAKSFNDFLGLLEKKQLLPKTEAPTTAMPEKGVTQL